MFTILKEDGMLNVLQFQKKEEEEGRGRGSEQTSRNLESFKLKKPQYGYNMQIFVGKTH